MNLNSIALENFRNYSSFEGLFEPGVNLIVGDNAQGKTNLLEAIAFLGSGKSFRTQKNSELVKMGEEVGTLQGDLFSQNRKQSIKWHLFSTGRPRQIFLNGIKKKSASDLSGVLHTVLFCPEDLMVLKAGVYILLGRLSQSTPKHNVMPFRTVRHLGTILQGVSTFGCC